jgi:hypothetical protein
MSSLQPETTPESRTPSQPGTTLNLPREPGPGEVILVAKAGAGVSLLVAPATQPGPQPESKSSWLQDPGPGRCRVALVAGEGFSFPQYVIEVLKHFEAEYKAQQPEQPEVGKESVCVAKETVCGVEW